VALIRTKRGDCFHQDYESIESFRKDVQDHMEDVEWGTLLLRETGDLMDRFRSGDKRQTNRVDTELTAVPEGLNPQAALREATIKHFRSNKLKAYIAGQLRHINIKQQLCIEMRRFFGERGNPIANAPLEDIIAEKEETESFVLWLEAICEGMRNNLTEIKLIEDFMSQFMAQ
jgi:uncharacterized protein YnzC (UPF0291/DUF896 family)